jgi:cellulose synthase/poly-beta-1,6-N-acetylglucosamine synthase-like glycosyltransferase
VANPLGLLGNVQLVDNVVRNNVERRMFDQVGATPCMPEAIGAYRRTALSAIGGVPDATLADDADLTMALQRHGWRVTFANNAVAWSEGGVTPRIVWRQQYRAIYGTAQSIWKHRRASAVANARVRNDRASRRVNQRLTWFALPYTIVFTLFFALIGPLIDLYALVALMRGHVGSLLAVWGLFHAVAVLTAACGLVIAREPLWSLWAVPFQQVIHRHVAFVAALRAVRSAVTHRQPRWYQPPRSRLFTVVSPPAELAPEGSNDADLDSLATS